MRKFKIPAILVQLILALCISIHYFYQSEAAENLALFIQWIIIILGILYFLIVTEIGSPYSKTARKIKYILILINVILMASLGWFFTAGSMLITTILVWAKYKSILDGAFEKKESESYDTDNLK